MIDLKVTDDRHAKFELVFKLAERPDLLPPVYIVSSQRSDRLRTFDTIPGLRDIASVVVSSEEYEEYRAELGGDVNIMCIPEGYRGHAGGLGRARQFCLDQAYLVGHRNIMVLDDDLLLLTLLYHIGDDKVSRAAKKHIGAAKLPTFHFGLLNLVAQLALDAFEARPEAVIASPQCNNANRTINSSKLMWALNQGGPPSQIQVWDVDRWVELCGEIDLERFNYHGEDISIAKQIVTAGGSVVDIPAVVGNWLDYETESVIRNEDTAPALRQAEHDHLMSDPFGRYIRTKLDIIGRPQWHSLNWKALQRDGMVAVDKRYFAESELSDIL